MIRQFATLISLILALSDNNSCVSHETREIISLNGKWNFAVDSSATLDSTKWGGNGIPVYLARQVSVPHTWNSEKLLARYTGNGWYERSFTVLNDQLSRLINIQFGGVYHDAVVYINGKKAGEHIGSGYNSFIINATPFVKAGKNREHSDATAEFDMMMFNEYYSTWYKKTIDAIPGELDRIIGEYPGKTMTISEWGLCDPPKPDDDERRAIEMARQINIYGSKPYIAGAIYFCLNDYRSQRGEDYSAGYPRQDHGVTDGYLHPKRSYQTLKEISSPVEIQKISRIKNKISVMLHGKTGIPSYIIRNYILEAGEEKILIKELAPGEKQTYYIRRDNKEFSILRPTGFEVLHRKI